MMKKLHLWLLCALLMTWITGCEKSIETPKVPQIDSTLPSIDTIRTLPDVTSVGLEWTPVYADRVEGYYLYRIEGSSIKRIATIKDKYISHYVDTKLSPDTQYTYRMATYSVDKRESSPSENVIVTTLGGIESVPFLTAITGLPGRVKLVWRPHPSERVESYIIERNTLNSTRWEEIAKVEGRLNAEYIDKDLKENTLFRYRVKVSTFDGIVSKPSQIVEANTKPLPKPVLGVSATTNLPKKILLKWEPVSQSDLSHYKIYRSNNSMLFYTFHAKTTAIEYEDLVSENGKSYYYKVVAVDVDGLESKQPDSPVMGKTLSALRAPIVSEVKADGNTVLIRWQSDENAVKYTILREFESGGTLKKQVFTSVSENSYHDGDMSLGVTYKYNIIAIDKYGIASDPSESVIVTLPRE